eukprot:scaffold2318_cov396-Prasinococcus_capsulatus_cf.AAC.8
MGRAFKAVPDSLAYSWPLGKFAAVVLFVYFGIKMLKESYGTEPNAEGEEFNDANEVVTKSGERRPTWWAKWATPIATLLETFTLIFIAEWGDRSMFAIITLSAAATSAQSVFFGALGGHFAATAIAVIAGTLMAKYLSERMVSLSGRGVRVGLCGAMHPVGLTNALLWRRTDGHDWRLAVPLIRRPHGHGHLEVHPLSFAGNVRRCLNCMIPPTVQ